jgi:AraC family transcriptional regulator
MSSFAVMVDGRSSRRTAAPSLNKAKLPHRVRMVSEDFRSEYARRMHRVLEHIDRHLDESLGLETLAGVASFSAFHFHRLFSAWMGETIGVYLRRRRLELGALRLVSQPELPVLHVALSVGFGSSEAFARAFKTRFGLSPTAWRSKERKRHSKQSLANGKIGQAMSKPGQPSPFGGSDHGVSRVRTEEDPMTVKIVENVKLVERQPTTIAYFRHVGPYGQPISDFWQKTVYPWMVTNNLLGQPRVGVSHDDPKITAPEKCRYDAGVEVPPGFVGSGKHLMTTLPGGKYAAAEYKGTAKEIGEAWSALLRDWLPESGMQLDSRPFFEYYARESTYDPKTGVFTCQLFIPVAAL